MHVLPGVDENSSGRLHIALGRTLALTLQVQENGAVTRILEKA